MKKSGFTIVELLIVVVVIGILAAIAIVAYSGVSSVAKRNSLHTELSSIARNLDVFRVQAGDYPTSLSDADYLVGNSSYDYTYTASSDRKSFCLQGVSGNLSSFVSKDSPNPQPGTCAGAEGIPGDGIVDGGSSSGGSWSIAEASWASDYFNNPSIDGMDSITGGNGNLYKLGSYSDFGSGGSGYTAIYQINPTTGNVSLYAGSIGDTVNHQDGIGTSARIVVWLGQEPAADASGNIHFIAFNSSGNAVFKKLNTSTAEVTTIRTVPSPFDAYSDFVISPDGNNAYLSEDGTAITRVSLTDSSTSNTSISGVLAGGGYYTDSRRSVVHPNGNLYRLHNEGFYSINLSTGVSTLVAGVSGWEYTTLDGVGTDARLRSPMGITLGSGGDIYFGQYGDGYGIEDNLIRIYNPTTHAVSSIIGGASSIQTGTGSSAGLFRPRSVLRIDDNKFVVFGENPGSGTFAWIMQR